MPVRNQKEQQCLTEVFNITYTVSVIIGQWDGDISFLIIGMIQKKEKGYKDIFRFLSNLSIYSIRRPYINNCKTLCLVSGALSGFPKLMKIA